MDQGVTYKQRKSIAEVLQQRERSSERPAKKRKVIPMTTQVITQGKCMEAIRQAAEKKNTNKETVNKEEQACA